MLRQLLQKIIPPGIRPGGYLNRATFDYTHGQVAAGPFKGLQYIQTSQGSAYIPKLLGIYERELYPVIEQAIAANFPLIIDVGAAEGYYACGLALRSPVSHVIAFEGHPPGRALLQTTIDRNNLVGRVSVRGFCTRKDFVEALATHERVLLVIDCEGYEHILLDPLRAPGLERATILVECHDHVVPGLTDELYERFEKTHDITRIEQTPRSAEEFPIHSAYTKALGRKRIEFFVGEWRPTQMWWLWMTPK